jgi:pantoate--beta-alanine ligase
MGNVAIVESTITGVREACDSARSIGKRVSLVPTMGSLHEGHLRLVDEAMRVGRFVVVSIFVNPTQFGPKEDLDSYPHTLEADLKKLNARGVDVVFTPTPQEMYPAGHSSRVVVNDVSQGLCGALRPGHFEGVATVVTKLFNIVGPCFAIFGRKDYQQLQVICKMVRDLDQPVQIVGVPTVREADGLALSSRNVYLGESERSRALALSRGLSAAHRKFFAGERNVGSLRSAIMVEINNEVDTIEYIVAADPRTMVRLADTDQMSGQLLIAIAVRIGSTRLIDNMVLGEDEPPSSEVGEPID